MKVYGGTLQRCAECQHNGIDEKQEPCKSCEGKIETKGGKMIGALSNFKPINESHETKPEEKP